MLETAWESRWLPDPNLKVRHTKGMHAISMAGTFKRGLSSAGRAPALQAGGREFESLSLHWKEKNFFLMKNYGVILRILKKFLFENFVP